MIQIDSIALADDDSDDAYIFQECIKEINPSILLHLERNGNGLMKLLQSLVPDMLFLDLDMPYKNGLECLVEMKGIPRLANTPKIIFSSTNKPSNIETAYEMGAHLFMTKSYSFQEQCAKLSAILRLNWEDPEAVKQQYCINGRYTSFL